MKIDLDKIDLSQFKITWGDFCGQECALVNPIIQGTNWTQTNSIFRSSVWDKEGRLVSAGMKKFTNWMEKPEEFPIPNSLHNTNIMTNLS